MMPGCRPGVGCQPGGGEGGAHGCGLSRGVGIPGAAPTARCRCIGWMSPPPLRRVDELSALSRVDKPCALRPAPLPRASVL